MAKMFVSLETNTKERVGQQTPPAAQLVALAGRELAAVRHHGSPRFVGESGTKCAMLAAIAAPHSLGPRGSRAVVHFSGDESVTRPLQFDSQFTNEPLEMSSAECLSTNEPPSYTILLSGSAFGPASIHLRVPHTILDISHNVAEMSNTAFSTNDVLLSSSTTFAYINPTKPALMRPLNNEHITQENGAQPQYNSYDAESASQCIDVTGRTTADCAQHLFSMSATGRIEGEWSPQIAMKRCLCPGTPDPPTHLASATMHKKGLLHGTQVALAPDWTPQLKGLQLVCCIAATYGMGPVYGWGASAREVSGKFPNFMHLKQFDSIALTRINSGAPLEGPDEWVCCIDAADAAVTRCEWDKSTRKVSSKFSKLTDLTKFARTAVVCLNWGAPLAGADNISRIGSTTATNATVARCEWDASFREMSSELSNVAELRKFFRIDGAHINSGAPLAGAGEGQQMWCIAAINATLALCEWDASTRKVSSKFSTFTDLTKLARIAVVRLNRGAPLAGADNIKRMGCIAATNATVALCEWDASLREMSSKLSNLEELRKFVRIDGAHINSGAPPAGEGDGEQTRCIAATNATVALCEWDASSRKVSSKISRAMSRKKVDLVDERGQRYQTKGKFGGNGRSSHSRSPGKDNHETVRGSQ